MKNEGKLDFITGAAVDSNIFYIACTFEEEKRDEISGTVMYFYQHHMEKKWFYHDLPGWRVTSVAFPEPKPDSPREIYALSDEGDVEIASRSGAIIKKIDSAGLAGKRGYVNAIRYINDSIYVCGYGGQVYKEAKTGWDDLSMPYEGANPPSSIGEIISELSKGSVNNIFDIARSPDGSLIAIGENGLIARLSNGKWSNIPRVTAADLHSACLDEQQTVWIVGAGGTVIKKTREKEGYEVIPIKIIDIDFHSVCSHEGSIYIGADDGIYNINEGSLARLHISIESDIEGVSNIESKDGVLWVLCTKKLLRYDGNNWECFEHPNNIEK